MSKILICLAVIVGMAVPATIAHWGQHLDGPGLAGHDHSSSVDAVAFLSDVDGIGGAVHVSCDPAAGHCITGFVPPAQPALRLPAVRASAHSLPKASAWSHQRPETATPPPRV